MTNDGQRPSGRLERDPWDTDSWVIIDDTAGVTAAGAAAPQPPPAAPAADDWGSFGQGETWNGISMAPPISGAAAPPSPPSPARAMPWGSPGAPAAGPVPVPVAAPAADPPAAAGDSGDTWFFGDATGDDPYQDDFPDGSRRGSPAGARNLGRTRGIRIAWSAGALVTFLVAGLSVLLVAASAVWHPQAP